MNTHSTTNMTYYKSLDVQGRSCYGGDLRWSLPTWDGQRWVPGDWMPAIPDVTPCKRGYHAAIGARGLLEWLHERVYVIESASPWVVVDESKAVTAGPVRLVRGTAWDARLARLFAVSCAADVLPVYEQQCPDDRRVSDALVVAREYADGMASDAALATARTAASDAAWAAEAAANHAASENATNAAWAAAHAAWAAVNAANAAAFAEHAVWGAAIAATCARAARDIAWGAAVDAQAARLARYLDGEVDV